MFIVRPFANDKRTFVFDNKKGCTIMLKANKINSDDVMKFINVIDRYLQVSYVYSQRIKESKKITDKSEDRLRRLIRLLEEADINEEKDCLIPLEDNEIKGQNVVASTGIFEQTKCYQKVIKARLNSDSDSYNQLSAQNNAILNKLINMEPEKCLSSFKTVSYAWDILTEFASLSLLPSSEKLTATDMIHMHVIELRQHLFRVIAHAKMLMPESALDLKGDCTIKELFELKTKEKLIETLVIKSMNESVTDLMSEIHYYTDQYPEMFKIIAAKEADVVQRLQQESSGYPDMLEENLDMKKAEKLCNALVLYGITVGYITWLSFAEKEEVTHQILFKNCLFCTRTLLEEERWEICKGVAMLGLKIIDNYNKSRKSDKNHINSFMIQANLFYAKKMLKEEKVFDEIREWDLTGAHDRYRFLQYVLLDEHDRAFEMAKNLLEKDTNGNPNMSYSEFKEWPILKSFRESIHWSEFSNYAQCKEE